MQLVLAELEGEIEGVEKLPVVIFAVVVAVVIDSSADDDLENACCRTIALKSFVMIECLNSHSVRLAVSY